MGSSGDRAAEGKRRTGKRRAVSSPKAPTARVRKAKIGGMGRGTGEIPINSEGLRRAVSPGAWDGVEIKILCHRRPSGIVEIETVPVAYDLDCTRADLDLKPGPARPAGKLTKAKLGEQINRRLLEQIATAIGVPYDAAEWSAAEPRRGAS